MTDSKKKLKAQSAVKNARYLMVIIVIGFVMAIVFGMKAQFPPTPRNIVPAAPTWPFTVMIILAVICAILVLIVRQIWTKNFGFDKDNTIANILLDTGRLNEAEALYEKVLVKFNGHFAMKLNLAIVAIRKGEFERAEKFLKECAAAKQMSKVDSEFRAIISGGFALLYAIWSDLEHAVRYYDEAIKLSAPELRGHLAIACALIAIRRGKFENIADMPEEEWFAAEAGGGRRMRVLRAFALSKMPSTDQSQALMQQMLAGARPFRPGEYDYLAARIPELKTFLIEHGFSQSQVAPASPPTGV